MAVFLFAGRTRKNVGVFWINYVLRSTTWHPMKNFRSWKTGARLVALIAATILTACSPRDNPVGKPIADATPASLISQQQKKEIVGRLRSEAVSIPDKSKAAKTAYVFFDPRCSHCADLFVETLDLNEFVHFVWIPVALLGPTSSAAASDILAAKDPYSALLDHETKLKHGKRPHDYPQLTEASSRAVRKNTELLANLVAQAPIDFVPFTVVVDRNDNVDFVPGYETREIYLKAARI